MEITSDDITLPATVKATFRFDAAVFDAFTKLAAQDKMIAGDKLAQMMTDAVIAAGLLKPADKKRVERLKRLRDRAIQIAINLFQQTKHNFPSDFTLQVFRLAMQQPEFAADYKAHIGNKDPYKHKNPLKDVNRELGWNIKNSIPVEVQKDADGKVIEKRNLKGEVIQSYTLLQLHTDALKAAA
jgi:hypothetical protein